MDARHIRQRGYYHTVYCQNTYRIIKVSVYLSTYQSMNVDRLIDRITCCAMEVKHWKQNPLEAKYFYAIPLH